MMSVITTCCCISIGVVLLWRFINSLKMRPRDKRVCVVVLGDIGRSPRMQYHCMSLARHGFIVDVIGYSGATPHTDLTSSGRVHLHYIPQLPPLPQNSPRLAFLLYAPLKVLCQLIILLYMLIYHVGYQSVRSDLSKYFRPAAILVQTPPAIPTLAIAKLASWLLHSKLIVDWHNFGYTILALRLGSSHWLVKLAAVYEKRMAVSGGFCVTDAMRKELASSRWNGVIAQTLNDRPPSMFYRRTAQDKTELFSRLRGIGDIPQWDLSTPPAVLVSSTSWTADEDFSILFDALVRYDNVAFSRNGPVLPPLLCLITGRGPLRTFYEEKISSFSLKVVRVCTLWVSAEDYPVLLGCADIGVSLHNSSSGFDLPMKVVDMFGSNLPVCAIGFGCLSELVRHRENGLIFENAVELFHQLCEVFDGFDSFEDKTRSIDKPDLLTSFRQNLQSSQVERWDDSWDCVALPVIMEAIE